VNSNDIMQYLENYSTHKHRTSISM